VGEKIVILTGQYQGCGGGVQGQTEAKTNDFLEQIEQSGRYFAEPKRDGIWGCISADGRGTTFLSRNDATKEMRQLAGVPFPSGTVVVGELGYGSEEARARKATIGHEFADVFDILFYHGNDVRLCSLQQRLVLLDKLYEEMAAVTHRGDAWSNWYRRNPIYKDNFVERYKNEPEGLVLKRLDDGAYVGNRYNKNWWKVKKVFETDYVVLGWTMSAAVTKRKSPACEALVCGGWVPSKTVAHGEVVHDRKLVNGVNMSLIELVRVGSMSRTIAEDVAANFNQNYEGRILVVRNFRLFEGGSCRHPNYGWLRDDKPSEYCVFRVDAAAVHGDCSRQKLLFDDSRPGLAV
jgi:ATP-dependent DNA ligase